MLDKKKKIKTCRLPEKERLVSKDSTNEKKTAMSNPRKRHVTMAAAGTGMIMKKDTEEISHERSGLADWAI